jgi:phosphatidylserine/phosphatidylglycerophosphate/cardiolipin synthase-like enzyme
MMTPRMVITGSFNMTANANRSRENIVVIEDHRISQAYISEWAQLWSFSEPLDWEHTEPHHPEIYVGT